MQSGVSCSQYIHHDGDRHGCSRFLDGDCRIVEKTGEVDEEQLRKLFRRLRMGGTNPGPEVPEPGAGYRALRILGVLTICIAAGLADFGGIMFTIGPLHAEAADLEPVFAIARGAARLRELLPGYAGD